MTIDHANDLLWFVYRDVIKPDTIHINLDYIIVTVQQCKSKPKREEPTDEFIYNSLCELFPTLANKLRQLPMKKISCTCAAYQCTSCNW